MCNRLRRESVCERERKKYIISLKGVSPPHPTKKKIFLLLILSHRHQQTNVDAFFSRRIKERGEKKNGWNKNITRLERTNTGGKKTMIEGTVEKEGNGGSFEESSYSSSSSSSSYSYLVVEESNQNCVASISAAECMATAPCLRIPTVACCSVCVKCYGGPEDRDVSVDNMRGNDGTFVGCTREMANRIAARDVGFWKMASEDFPDFAWGLFDAIVMMAITGVIVITLHVFVAVIIISVRGCSNSVVAINFTASFPNRTSSIVPLPLPPPPPPSSSSSSLALVPMDLSVSLRKYKDNIVAEALASRCPSLSLVFSTKTARCTVLVPCFGTVAITLCVKGVGWTHDKLKRTFRSFRSKRRYEA